MGDQPNEEYLNFQKALKMWEEISLPEVQKKLDDEALEIKENQKSLLISRKDLATKTKQFKKLEDDAKLNEIKPLLKAYQNEIDNLTKKGKFVETAFFNVYKDISEAPDPKPLLSSSLKSFKTSSEIDALKDENAKLQEKLLKYKDYETVKAKLIEGEQKHAESLKVKLLLKDDEYKSRIDETERKFKVTENKYERKIALLTKQVSELKALNEISKNKLKSQSKLLQGDDDDEDGEEDDGDEDDTDAGKHTENLNDVEPKSALRVELDLATRDLEYSKTKVLELEKRNQELKESLSKLEESYEQDEKLNKLRESNLMLEKNNSILLQKSNSDKRTIIKLNTELSKATKDLIAKESEYSQKLSKLKQKLDEHSDYDEIKNELSILRSFEFDVDLDNEKSAGDSSIDHTLMVRNRKLNNDLVELRNKCSKLEQQIRQLTDNSKRRESQISSLQSINEKLESDISNVRGNNDNWEAMSMISGVSRFPPARSIAPSTRFSSHGNGKISPAASIAGFDDSSSMIGGGGADNGGNNSLLPLITQQRDRFRSKNTELETKLRETTKTIGDLKKQNTVLQTKVNNLTTEVKFLQSKSARGSGPTAIGSGKPAAANPYSDQFSSTTYDVLFDDYESFSFITNSKSLHWLQKTLGNENTKKLDKKLNGTEKYFYNFLKIILTNQTSRTFFLIYFTAIHSVLVLFLLKLFFGGGSVSTTDSIVKKVTKDVGSEKILAAAAAAAADSIKVPVGGGVARDAADAIKVAG
ncbi:Coy1 protein [Saccharomycopsis crataegensis]|uniref:Protein CASP n=1 Tax=Saccharomycopsis crataegensis TaxID=43959 RepID=A0AAV5QKW3_9ASCO|nr:Coy1 protein [Saccharomycopsis crataegensis]